MSARAVTPRFTQASLAPARLLRSLGLHELHCSSIDEKYDLATYVPGLPFFERLRCFLERVGAI
jgi:hypothetical protein